MNIRSSFRLQQLTMLCVLAVVFVLQFNPLQMTQLAWAGIGDESSYLAHAFTIGLDFDLDYSNEPLIPAALNNLTGMPPHPVGSGILLAPFVGLFSLVDRLSGHPIIHNHNMFIGSWSLVGVVVAKFSYFFGSLFCIMRGLFLLRKDDELSPLLILMLILGTGISAYTLTNTIKPHIFEFFLFSAAFYAFACSYKEIGIDKKKSHIFYSISYACITLAILVRPNNIICLLFPVIWFWIGTNSSALEKRSLLKSNLWFIFYMGISLAIIFLFNWCVYKNIMPSMHQLYGTPTTLIGERYFQLKDVNIIVSNILIFLGHADFIWHILFSDEYGVALTNPLILFGYILIPIVIFENKSRNVIHISISLMLVVLVGTFFLYIYVFFVDPGGDYGWRYLFPLIFICIFPLALIAARYLRIIKPVLLFFSSISLILAISYGLSPQTRLTQPDVDLVFFQVPHPANHHYISRAFTALSERGYYCSILTLRAPSMLLTNDATKPLDGGCITEVDKYHRFGTMSVGDLITLQNNVFGLTQRLFICLVWLLLSFLSIGFYKSSQVKANV